MLRSDSVVLNHKQPFEAGSDVPISGPINKFIFCSYRIYNEIKEMHFENKSARMGRLSAAFYSCSFRDQLKVLMAELGNLISKLDDYGLMTQCIALDELLDVCNLVENLWNICEIFSINSASHCYFEIIRWLQASIEMTWHVSLDERLNSYKETAKPELRHMASGGADPSGHVFWEDVFCLSLRGRLSDAWELLQLHSEVRSVLDYTSSVEDRRGLGEIKNIFLTHPIALVDDFLNKVREILAAAEAKNMGVSKISVVEIFSTSDEAMIKGLMNEFSTSWMRWHTLTSRIRSDPYFCPLLAKMPQLQNLLHVLAGDINALKSLCVKYVTSGSNESSLCWQQFALCKLLYCAQSPPPFSKPVVVDILEDAFVVQSDESSKRNIGGGGIDIAKLLHKVLSGHVTPVVKFIYELSVKSFHDGSAPTQLKTKLGNSNSELVAVKSSPGDFHVETLSLAAMDASNFVATSACVHLLLLLDKSDLIPAKNDGTSWGSYDASSFLEGMLLEYATKLNARHSPLEVVCGYLALCPTRCNAVARVLLPQRQATTDADAIQISKMLRSMSLSSEADVYDSTRGVRWLSFARRTFPTSVLTTVREKEISISLLFLGVTSDFCGNMLAAAVTRALTFFFRAGDASRLCGVFDAAFAATTAALYAVATAGELLVEADGRGRKISPEDDIEEAETRTGVFCKIPFTGLALAMEENKPLLDAIANSGTSVRNLTLLVRSVAATKKWDVNCNEKSQEFVSAEVNERRKEFEGCQEILTKTLNNVKMLFDSVPSEDALNSISMTPLDGAYGRIAPENLGISLMRYVEAIELALKSTKLLQNADKTQLVNNRELAVYALKKSCQLVTSLMSRGAGLSEGDDEYPRREPCSVVMSIAPQRYQYCLLDICLWLQKMHSSILAHGGEDLHLDPNLFSRSQTDDLLYLFHQLTDDLHSRLLLQLLSDNVGEISNALTSYSKALRPAVLHLYMTGLIQTNSKLLSTRVTPYSVTSSGVMDVRGGISRGLRSSSSQNLLFFPKDSISIHNSRHAEVTRSYFDAS